MSTTSDQRASTPLKGTVCGGFRDGKNTAHVVLSFLFEAVDTAFILSTKSKVGQ